MVHLDTAINRANFWFRCMLRNEKCTKKGKHDEPTDHSADCSSFLNMRLNQKSARLIALRTCKCSSTETGFERSGKQTATLYQYNSHAIYRRKTVKFVLWHRVNNVDSNVVEP